MLLKWKELSLLVTIRLNITHSSYLEVYEVETTFYLHFLNGGIVIVIP